MSPPPASHVSRLLADFASGCADPVEHVNKTLERIKADESKAYLSVDRAGAAERAAFVREGRRGGRLYGLCIAVKDNIAYTHLPATCASKYLENYTPPYHATIVERMLAEGAVIVGKTNMDEFACGSSGENSAYCPTQNPLVPGSVPGGSSSGSAAALAAELCDLAVGSDTGGSVRIPASFCGITGFKPSYGTVSRFGLIDLAMSLESPAPMARAGDVAGLALLLSVMAGPDPRDLMTAGAKPIDHTAGLDAFEPRGKRIGIVKEFFEGLDDETSKAVNEAVARFEAEGGKLVELSLPSMKYAVPTYCLLNFAEFASAMQKFDGLKYGFRGREGDLFETYVNSRAIFGREVKRRILTGSLITQSNDKERWFERARRSRGLMHRELTAAFSQADIILAPASPFVPFRMGEKVSNPLAMYLSDVLMVPANIAGMPAGVLPTKGSRRVGLQVMGPRGADVEVLRAMRAHERWSA